ncbi:MAG: Anti sigma-E protein RseA, N-terminal domain, partial [Pseudomonadota bacterium]
MNAHEELSAWMDGQAAEGRAEHMTKKILQDPESRARWNEYHLIGDAMRSAA